ncbi:MAG: hypothetical protein ACREUG_08870 [Steroidobacteraceae bacterium]
MRCLLAAASLLTALAVLAEAGAAEAVATPPAAPPLAFRIDSGDEVNAFVRRGDVAAHMVLRSGTSPRLLVAFPAGDSGVAVWFSRTATPVTWTLDGTPRAVTLRDARGRPLYGIEAQITVDAGELGIERALLSSVRVLRDYTSGGMVPAAVLAPVRVMDHRLLWSRDRLDGAAGYRLAIEVLDGGTVSATAITAGSSALLHLRLVAATGDPPLAPLGGAALLNARAVRDARERDVLQFLSYREKYLAGSWRFDTYFGRDTLMSMTLLQPVLQPEAMESGLRSVLIRLAPDGEVAHEEAIGEYAILENERAGRGPSAAPVYDYGMIDESFLLAPVAARWLLDDPRGRVRATRWLAERLQGGRSPRGESQGGALTRNLRWVVERAASFAARPVAADLIGLKPGHAAGDWRDSRDGLGGGRYPYDVNAVLVPAALRAIDRLLRSGVLDPYLTPHGRSTLRHARAEEKVWARSAQPLFRVRIAAAAARRDVRSYALSLGVDPAAALESLGSLGREPVTFEALALDVAGRPIPVMHSDVGFALLFESPSVRMLESALEVTRPFPAGLLTPVGLLVANPAYADRRLQSLFTNTAYHGTVIWSWQQAVLLAGLDRQLARSDLPRALHDRLAGARARLDAAIQRTARFRASELWSWSFANGSYRVVPFGEQGTRVEEADAAQLWSTVYLALGTERQ